MENNDFNKDILERLKNKSSKQTVYEIRILIFFIGIETLKNFYVKYKIILKI